LESRHRYFDHEKRIVYAFNVLHFAAEYIRAHRFSAILSLLKATRVQIRKEEETQGKQETAPPGYMAAQVLSPFFHESVHSISNHLD